MPLLCWQLHVHSSLFTGGPTLLAAARVVPGMNLSSRTLHLTRLGSWHPLPLAFPATLEQDVPHVLAHSVILRSLYSIHLQQSETALDMSWFDLLSKDLEAQGNEFVRSISYKIRKH